MPNHRRTLKRATQATTRAVRLPGGSHDRRPLLAPAQVIADDVPRSGNDTGIPVRAKQ
jgi:hypothetical protein